MQTTFKFRLSDLVPIIKAEKIKLAIEPKKHSIFLWDRDSRSRELWRGEPFDSKWFFFRKVQYPLFVGILNRKISMVELFKKGIIREGVLKKDLETLIFYRKTIKNVPSGNISIDDNTLKMVVNHVFCQE